MKKLKKTNIDLLFSGTTCNMCLIKNDLLYVTNIGDSRSIIGYKEGSKLPLLFHIFKLIVDKFKSKPLSFDHKPETPSEKKRILKNNGRVSAILDNNGRPCGPLRVWLKNEEIPGLAMTRSIGDLVAGSVGVTWKPEIAIYKLCQEDRIITIASDGIWEVLENSNVSKPLKFLN